MIYGIGTDIVAVERVASKIAKGNGFKEKTFTVTEIAYCEGKAKPAEHYAARFAAKEALADKAFYAFSLLKNKEAKDHIYATLDSLGLIYMPSHTNFVFFKPKKELGAFKKI